MTVPLPDEAGRAAILGVHLRNITLDESAGDKTQVARQLATLTAGFSGEQLVNAACLNCCCVVDGLLMDSCKGLACFGADMFAVPDAAATAYRE